MRIFALLLTLASLLGSASVQAGTPPASATKPKPKAEEEYKALRYKSMPYRLLIPLNYDKSKRYPVVLYLHDYGGRGKDNVKQLKNDVGLFIKPAIRQKFPCFVIVPQAPGAWLPVPIPLDHSLPAPKKITPSIAMALEILNVVETEYSVNRDWVYLSGASNGACAVWYLLERGPRHWAAAVTMSGGGDPREIAGARSIPLWDFHGAKDRSIPVERSREMIAALKAAGGNPKYTEYPDKAHGEAFKHAYTEAELLPWMFAHSLNPSSKPVVLNPQVPPAPKAAAKIESEITKIPDKSGANAAQDAPFVNSLGMKFVPVPGTNVLFCIHDTRKADYRKYAEAKDGVDQSWSSVAWKGLPVSDGEDHPVVSVSWEDARAFCSWLSVKEGRTYRLPRDHEWSMAAGIGNREVEDTSPESKTGKITDEYPWGSAWPPPQGAGNFCDSALKDKRPTATVIDGYRDGYATTSPVMSFTPNKLGLYDMAGNVWQWCEDPYRPNEVRRVVRGGSWLSVKRERMLSSFRDAITPNLRNGFYGFRCVLVR